MKILNVKEILKQYALKEENVAKELFPNNKYPEKALLRILNNKALLNSQQVLKLAALCNIKTDELYTSNGWVATNVKNKNTFVFHNKKMKAVLYVNTNITRIYSNNKLFFEDIIHSSNITLSEYTAMLNSKILAVNKAIK